MKPAEPAIRGQPEIPFPILEDRPDRIASQPVLAGDARERPASPVEFVETAGRGDPQPALLILDGRLMRMSGWQCLELLRTSERTNRLPVLMLTAAIDELERSRRAADHCTAYLVKPFDIDDLLASIQDLMTVCAQSSA